MKKSSVKLFVLLLGICFIISSAAGCGRTGQGGSAPERGETGRDDLITLTYGLFTLQTTGVRKDSAVFDKIAEETGVLIDFIVHDVEKYKVLMAGGDMPDIIHCYESIISGVTRQLIDSGTIIPLDDLIDKYGQNIKKNIPLALVWAKEVQGGGTTYTMPNNVTKADTSAPNPAANITFEVRWDIYEALGKPDIIGDEGLLEFGAAAMEMFPTSPQGYKAYAFSYYVPPAIWPARYSWPRAQGWYWAPGMHYVDMFTGELQSMFTDPDGAFWQSLTFYNKTFQRGLFDPEGFTQNNAQYAEKVSTGQVYITLANYWPSPDKDIVGETLFVKLPGYIPYCHLLYPFENPVGDQGSYARSINSKCKYPEKAMQLMNYLDSPECARMLHNGIQGVDWDYIDGVPQYIGEYAQAILDNAGPEYMRTKYGIEGNMINYSISGDIIDAGDGYPINLKKTANYYAMFTPEVEKQWARQFDPNFSYKGQVYEMWYKQGLWTTSLEIPLASNLMAPLAAEYAEIQAKIETFYNDNLARVVMAENDAAFKTVKDEFIAKSAELGGLEADAEVARLYEEAKALERRIRGN